MQVFVLTTGRSGSVTFSKAMEHLDNFTVGHESNFGKVGPARFVYPDNHIEVDNRLSWFLGMLPTTTETKFVHLTRDRTATAASFVQRWRSDPGTDHPKGRVMEAFAYGLVARWKPWPEEQRMELAEFYVDTINANIREYLRSRDHRTVDLSEAADRLPELAGWMGAVGDLDAAAAEFGTRHNASA